MGRIILTPGGPRHPLEVRAPAVRDEATVIIFLAVHSPSTPKVKVFPYTGFYVLGCSAGSETADSEEAIRELRARSASEEPDLEVR